ncbi:MAG: hypothetical protein MJZ91_10555 [Bacteroidales bacterium]|nr:hypothetical protein [Bacteroidales bacterium]
MKVLINQKEGPQHSTSWNVPWIEYLKQNHIECDTVDLFQTDAIKVLKDYDCLLWHFGQYSLSNMLEARSILYSAKMMGLKVFPDFNDAWHFDDKVAEMYALQAVGAPIPQSWVFYDLQALKAAMEKNELQFPIVAKLRSGSGSHNVKLIHSKSQLLRYARRMFGRGFDPAPSLLYKTSSNIRSSHDKATFMSKLKRAPEFLRVLKNAKRFPNEKGYVYLQEFIPSDGFDMKVVVVGDKLTGLHRPIRSHDFRASGGGECLYDKTLFSSQIIDSAFAAADALGFQCVGFDYVVDNRTGKGVIVEMSYGFSHTALMGLGGWFDREHNFHEETMNAPQELLKNMLEK